jgi:CBS domain-containing protein
MTVDLSVLSVRDCMIASPPVITPRTTVATALRLLREHPVPALPVWDKVGDVPTGRTPAERLTPLRPGGRGSLPLAVERAR